MDKLHSEVTIFLVSSSVTCFGQRGPRINEVMNLFDLKSCTLKLPNLLKHMCPMYMSKTILEIQCPELICHRFETIITNIFRALIQLQPINQGQDILKSIFETIIIGFPNPNKRAKTKLTGNYKGSKRIDSWIRNWEKQKTHR